MQNTAGDGPDRVRVCWLKRWWKCFSGECERKTFTESLPAVPPRCRMTARLRDLAGAEVAGGAVPWRRRPGGRACPGRSRTLVLDEFALILHLQDVYWSGEGQLSVEAVSLTAACLGLALVGFSPFGVKDVDGIELSLRITATGILIADGVLAFICVLKGKYRTALFGLFLPPVGMIGALRLARPSSIWARRRYRGSRLERATRRAAHFDRRWAPLQTDWEDFAGGKPSQPNPPASDDVHR
jgi:hypothetical protein